MGNYGPSLMTFVTETKTDMPSSKITKAEMYEHFQDGRRCYLGNSSAWFKMGTYCPISMKGDTQSKTEMLSSKITEAEAYDKKISKH
jgi:hypothetical protein